MLEKVERTCDTGCGRTAIVRTFVGVYDDVRCYEWTCVGCTRTSTAPVRRGYVSKRDERLWEKYKIREEDWHAMSAAQGGLCWICQQPPGVKGLMVDHCHETGVVRGLLCGNCNAGLGLMKDDVLRLERAIEYLTREWDNRKELATGQRDAAKRNPSYRLRRTRLPAFDFRETC